MSIRVSSITTLKSACLAALFGFALTLASCGDSVVDDDSEASAKVGGADDLPAIPVMGPEVNIIAFGDSLFAGYGLDPRDAYPEKLEGALRGKGIDARIVNAGVSGDTSAAGLNRLGFTLAAQDQKPDLFILELGGNDLLRGVSPAETRKNFEAMLTMLRDENVPVLLMGMRAPPNYGPQYQQQFDALYAELADEFGAQLIPFWLEDIFQNAALFQSDRIHPTADGIEELVASTLPEVVDALPEETKKAANDN